MHSLDFGQKILQSQPFSRRLKAELIAFDSGSAEISIPVTSDVKQQHGFVHGGVVSYLADNCLTFAGGSLLGDCVTSEFKINYVRPALGDRLTARSTVVHAGKRQAVCECRVYAYANDEERLIAVAQGTILRVDN